MATGDSILGLVDHILHHVRLGVGLGTVPVLGAAEAQDHLEDEGQQQQADAEARALVKGLGQIDLYFDDEINVVPEEPTGETESAIIEETTEIGSESSTENMETETGEETSPVSENVNENETIPETVQNSQP